MKLPLAPVAVFNLIREVRTGSTERKPLAVSGARELADALRRELVRGGDESAVRLGAADGAAALVYVIASDVTAEDEERLRAADTAGVPIVVLGPDPRTSVPYVLATDVLPLRAGEGFPIDALARLLAGKIDEEATQLAARLPVLRRGVVEALIARVSRQNGVVGAATFVPGVDFPVLTLNQLRLVLRIAQAYGQQVDRERAPEIIGTVGAGLVLRGIARQLLAAVPVAGWAVKGAVAYAGTRALGHTAVETFERRSSGRAQTGAPRADRA
jgi:uncharacterized protein (DUF697 family)